MKDFLNELDKQNIPYVSWKNNHELAESILGMKDIDILVPEDSQDSFIFLLKKFNWIELENKVSIFPSIKHFYRISEENNFHHMHVYFSLVTGESWIKEYKIPTECTQPLAITVDHNGMVWFAQTNTGNIAKFDPLTETFTEYDNPVWTELEQSFILSAIENNVPPQKLRSMMWGMDAFPDGSIWYTSRIPIQAEDNNVYFIGVLWKFSKDTNRCRNVFAFCYFLFFC